MLLTRTAAAERDLSEMWDYIAEDNEAAADRMLLEIDARCALMAEHPKMVRDRSQSQILPDVRSFPVGSYLIFYHETRSGHRDPAWPGGDCIGAGQILYQQILVGWLWQPTRH